MTGTEWALVTQAKQGDAHAFAVLYERYYKDLYRFALCYLKNADQAEDAVILGICDGKGADVDAGCTERVRDFIDRAGPVLRENRQLFDCHIGVPPVGKTDFYSSILLHETGGLSRGNFGFAPIRRDIRSPSPLRSASFPARHGIFPRSPA